MYSFDFLKEFFSERDNGRPNWFIPLNLSEVSDIERQLSVEFPEDLKAFYKEIGYGFLRVSRHDGDHAEPYVNNLILSPSQIALALNTSSEFGPPEGFAEHEYPILDLGDKRFLVIRKVDEIWGGVFWPSGEKIESTFYGLIKNLFYQDVLYFEDP